MEIPTEDGGDTEANGDEADFSGYAEELPTHRWSGEGVPEALRMIQDSPQAARRAEEYVDAPRPPLVYDFRGIRRR